MSLVKIISARCYLQICFAITQKISSTWTGASLKRRTKVGTAEKKTNKRKLELFCEPKLFETNKQNKKIIIHMEPLPQLFPPPPLSLTTLKTNY